jgi:predicted permease
LNGLLTLFLDNLLPVFLIAGAGFLLGILTDLDPRSLSQIILYIFSPCLIFILLTQSQVSNQQFLKIILFSLVFCFLMGSIAWLAGRLFHLDRGLLSSTMLTTMFTNAGNYGLPVVLFAFGEEALGYASIFFVINLSLAYTVGTVIASMGSVSFWKGILNLVKLPMIYAVLLAVVCMQTGWKIPQPLDRAVNLLADAAIPSMLVLLGLQLKSARLKGRTLPLTITSTLRLLVGPALALILLPLVGLTSAANQAIILEAGMPTAVITTVLAVEFNAEPAFATAAVLITTLLSPLTLTPLLSLLGA